MEIKITLDSPAIQERYDRGGVFEIAQILNNDLGYSAMTSDHPVTNTVYDENGNEAGTWEVVRA